MSGESVFAFASGKGGVGKTTASVNVGTAIAGMDYEVAVVDADLGMANLARFVDLNAEDATLHDVLSGRATIDDASYEIAAGIVVIPSGDELDSYAEVVERKLRTVVATLRAEYDFVILDVGAGISHETVLPLGLSDGVVLVSTPDPAAVENVGKTGDLVERAGGSVTGLIVNRVHDDEDRGPAAIADDLGFTLLGTVPEDDAVRQSLYDGVPLVVNYPKSEAATAYWEIADSVLGDQDTIEPSTAAEALGTTPPAADDDSLVMDLDGPAEPATEEPAEVEAAEPPADDTPLAEPAASDDSTTPGVPDSPEAASESDVTDSVLSETDADDPERVPEPEPKPDVEQAQESGPEPETDPADSIQMTDEGPAPPQDIETDGPTTAEDIVEEAKAGSGGLDAAIEEAVASADDPAQTEEGISMDTGSDDDDELTIPDDEGTNLEAATEDDDDEDDDGGFFSRLLP